MNPRARNRLIIAGLTDDCLKLLVSVKKGSSLDLIDVVSFDLGRGYTPEYLRELISGYLKREGYGDCRLIISLPRDEASLKLVKVPSENREEIDRIISLYASAYLPCPPEKVFVSYEITSSDASGYSQINLAVVSKDTIQRYRDLINNPGVDKPRIILGAFGLSWLYGYFYPRHSEDMIFADVDSGSTEICIFSKGRFVASRYFRQDCLSPGWKELFLKEAKITCDSLKKELPSVTPSKIVITGGVYIDGLLQGIKEKSGLPVEAFSYADKFKVFREYGAQNCSFASLLGIALNKKIDAQFIFMSGEEKERQEKRLNALSLIKSLVFLLLFIFALFVAVKLDIKNKEAYVGKIDREISSIKSEARKLEQMKARIDLVSARPSGKSLILGILSGVYEIIPDAVSLVDFHYYANENRSVIRGEAKGTDNVFLFASRLEGLSVFKGYKVNLNYISNKKTAQGEITYFEITCSK